MIWDVAWLPEAGKELEALDGSSRLLVRKAIQKTRTNPLPLQEGGYGKPLGNRGNRDLTGLMKIKLRASGLRILYKLQRQEERMLIVVIGIRADEEVYDTAARRMEKYDLTD